MDDYKNEKEWIALNHIWRSIPQSLREENWDNFKVVSELIKKHYNVEKPAPKKAGVSAPPDDYGYLNELSPEAKQLIIDLVNDGDKNLYHSIMAVIETHRGKFTSINQLWSYYSKRFGKDRSYIYTHEDEIREIMELCLVRMDRKGINPL
ncbi:MAG: hypothetical protein IKV00_08600 [Clostridia bacterium]|nr:hypothetical protein [Clostridia bacterium]